MEDEDGYMVIERSRQTSYVDAAPSKKEGPSKCWKITLGVTLGGSIALNLGLIILLIDSVTFDPDTAHRHLIVSQDRKTVRWGEAEQQLPDNPQRFNLRVWVLGQNGFQSGRHCWEVEVKHDGEWAVGVARQSVKRKGMTNFSTTEGIWAIGEYWGKGNYFAFTAPQHTRLSFKKKPRRVRVFLDYLYQQVEFFNAETRTSIFFFSNASFSGERIYPWFRVWDGTELVLHP
ncbi:butyrophilin subfamily 1 member A1-like isoform 2-T3 [Liasis olivaceus]